MVQNTTGTRVAIFKKLSVSTISKSAKKTIRKHSETRRASGNFAVHRRDCLHRSADTAPAVVYLYGDCYNLFIERE